MINRRQFFRMSAAASAVLRGADAPPNPPKKGMIVRSVRPEDLEMPLDGFTQWITPVERFFVRSHMYMPKVDAATWRLQVEGEVSTPLTLTLDELKKLPRAEVVSVLECAGNGRSFFEPTIIGMQWQYGAVGNARWAGVRLADVLRKAGLKASAREVLFNGADVPVGTMPDFERTVPLKKAQAADTLLAYEMNGEALPVSHGYPLRLVVPGWAGDSWTKWVTNIRVLDKEFDGFFMKTAYRYPVRPVAPGAPLDPAKDMAPVEGLRPKSVIAVPAPNSRVPAGPVRIQGAAWAGESPVIRVDVSTDSGRTWSPATLGRDSARYAWRLFEMRWTPARPGSYAIMARATDASGNSQPVVQDWNPSGYLWNVAAQSRIEAGAGPMPEAPPRSEVALSATVKSACVGCHEPDIIAGQRLTRAQWEREVDKMVRWGATVKPEDRGEILEFLARNFGLR
ncbi:MAG: sulfite oxidase [Bryobacteraceae bacterium]